MDNQQSSQFSEANNTSVNLNEVLKPYLKKWPWFFVSAFAAFVIGYISLKLEQDRSLVIRRL